MFYMIRIKLIKVILEKVVTKVGTWLLFLLIRKSVAENRVGDVAIRRLL